MVVSAPGKRWLGDEKVTDLFYQWHHNATSGHSITDVRGKIEERFDEIARGLGVSLDMKVYDTIDETIRNGTTPDYAASRGEYLTAYLVAEALGWDFIDAADCIDFTPDKQLYWPGTREKLRALLSESNVVLPGFYGAREDGVIYTFTRGGSDITGALVAAALKADLYENWTDVSGLCVADPRVVENPRTISRLTYRELRELSYSGATIFHEEAMFPVMRAGIPTQIKNTFRPEDPGTLIGVSLPEGTDNHVVTGIAGRKGFFSVTIEEPLMNEKPDYAAGVLQVLRRNDVALEHMPTGIDSLSLILRKAPGAELLKQLTGNWHEPLDRSVTTVPALSIIAIVGRHMARQPGVAARAFEALAEAGVNIRFISQGASELSIMVGVDDSNYETAIRSLYRVFS